MMLSSSGPANIAGNKVKTSIFIGQPWLRWRFRAFQPARSARRRFFHDFQRAAQPLLGAARQQERANRIDGHALPANDFAQSCGFRRNS